MDTLSLRKRIETTILTKKGKIIAQYILDNINTVAYLPASSLAKTIGVSDASIHRLSKQLGFESYRALQDELHSIISQHLVEGKFIYQSPGEVITEMFNGKTAEVQDIIDEAQRVALGNIGDVFSKLTAERIEEATEILLNSRRIYATGFWTGASLAEMFAEKFLYNNDNIYTITSPGPENIAKILSIQEADCVLVYSFKRPVTGLEKIVQIAKKNGAKVILIADKETNYLAPLSDICLIGSTQGMGFQSLIAPLMISEILLASSVNKVWKKRKEYTGNLNTILEDIDYYKR